MVAARSAGYASISIQLSAHGARLVPLEQTGFIARGSRPVFGRWFADGPMPALHLSAADEDE